MDANSSCARSWSIVCWHNRRIISKYASILEQFLKEKLKFKLNMYAEKILLLHYSNRTVRNSKTVFKHSLNFELFTLDF